MARIYDPQRVHRDPDWAALVEALRIHAAIPGVDHNRKLLLDRILRARIPDEFAKMTLLRALAGNRQPRSAPPVYLEQLGAAQRDALAEALKELLSEMQGWTRRRHAKRSATWRSIWGRPSPSAASETSETHHLRSRVPPHSTFAILPSRIQGGRQPRGAQANWRPSSPDLVPRGLGLGYAWGDVG